MQIRSIHLRNIKSHRDRTFEFTSGINVLSGPNGIGKSTIFEAIGYALFGVDARDFVSNSDRFLSIGSKRGEITIVFTSDDGEPYQVSRTVGTPAKWLLYHQVNGQFEVEEHAGAAETEKRIAQLIGLDNGRPLADQFKLVIGPFQHEFLGPFVLRQQTKRQEAFDEILGIDTWRTTYKKTADTVKALQSRNQVLSAEITLIDEQIAPLHALGEAINTCIIAKQAVSTQLADSQTELAALEHTLTAFNLAEQQLHSRMADQQRLAERISDGRLKISDKQRDVQNSQAAAEIVVRCLAGKQAYDAAEALLADIRKQAIQKQHIEQLLQNAQQQQKLLEQQIAHEEREITETKRRLHDQETEIDRQLADLPVADTQSISHQLIQQRSQLEQLQNQRGTVLGRIESLDEGQSQLRDGLCPWIMDRCKNLAETAPLHFFADKRAELEKSVTEMNCLIDSIQSTIAITEQTEKEQIALNLTRVQLLKNQAALTEQKAALTQREKLLQKLHEQFGHSGMSVTTFEQQLLPYSDLNQRIEAAEHERNRHQEARDQYLAHSLVADKLNEQIQTITLWQHKLDQLITEHEQAVLAYTDAQSCYQPEQHLVCKDKQTHLVAAIATNTQRCSEYEKELTRLQAEQQRLQELSGVADQKRSERDQYLRKEQLVTFLRNKVFKHVSSQLSERFRQEISLRADRIYRTIAESDEELVWGDGYQVVLRDLQDGQIRERSDDQLSGGQMMSAVVALRLAMLQTIGARIAFFDEPTSNLDATRRENLAMAFRAIDVGQEELSEHWYDQLFLISHDVAFSEITDQIIPVTP